MKEKLVGNLMSSKEQQMKFEKLMTLVLSIYFKNKTETMFTPSKQMTQEEQYLIKPRSGSDPSFPSYKPIQKHFELKQGQTLFSDYKMPKALNSNSAFPKDYGIAKNTLHKKSSHNHQQNDDKFDIDLFSQIIKNELNKEQTNNNFETNIPSNSQEMNVKPVD